ncbi:dienelactone hydrolase [Salinibacter sp. 10B]|uniref:dienelactone hydrolase family protein n=1 Tax=Salinibacter sp. 10B TaxID=1923971 RepID=UPI000CF460B6|nr:dienelactone hydrolase family protein [Salinibacter sp. 10B]PQJ33665.1 dienelactone hydrolase [Salinibacter sp. 10B]
MMIRSCSTALIAIFVLVGCGGQEDEGRSAAQEMAGAHEGDTPTATAAAREPAIPVDAREVTYTQVDGADVTGYLAAPSTPDSVLSAHGMDPSADRLPGIVVIHEWWGLNDNIRTATRRLAGKGYRALAVDLYADSVAQTPQQAQSLMQTATSTPERMMANLRGAHDYLRTETGAPRVAVMGWCFGGGLTFRSVADRPTAYDAAVAYYGTPDAMTDEVLQKVTTPILAHFGRQDEVVSTKQVEAFQSRLKGLDKDIQIHQYDAGHAFANPSGESYNPEAASTAWSRTTEFLRSHLYPTE